MNNDQDRDTQVSAVEELISRPPAWIIRWSITILVLIICLVILAAAKFSYPDKVIGAIQLISLSEPREVLARSSGRVMEIFKQEGDSTEKGEIIGFIEATANHRTIINLTAELKKCQVYIRKNQYDSIKELNFAKYNELGELQPDFEVFQKALYAVRLFLLDGYYEKRKAAIEKEMEQMHKMSENLKNQLVLNEREFALAEEDYKMNELLYKQNVIALSDVRSKESNKIQRQIPREQTAANIVQNDMAIIRKEQELIELQKNLYDLKTSLIGTLETFISASEKWKKEFLLIAPAKGILRSSVPLQAGVNVDIGQSLFYVSGSDTSTYGLATLSQLSFGKIKVGQPVLIKLDAYPYQEYGLLTGRVKQMSSISSAGNFSVSVSLDEKPLKTSSNYNIAYKMGLIGRAEIITEDRSLWQRLLYQYRLLIK